MSHEGGGSVVGLAIGCVGLGVYAAGMLTVLTAKGVMLIGKQIHKAYKEHERSVAERLKRQDKAREHLSDLRVELSQMDARIAASLEENKIHDPSTQPASLEYARQMAGILSKKRTRVLEKKSRADELAHELEATVEKLNTVVEQTPEEAPSYSVPADYHISLSKKREALQSRKEELEENLIQYKNIKHRVDEESRDEILGEAGMILDKINDKGDLKNRLEGLESKCPLEKAEQFLAELHQQYHQQLVRSSSDTQKRSELSRRILAARLVLEKSVCLTRSEKRDLQSKLEEADSALDANKPHSCEDQLKKAEQIVGKSYQRNAAEWSVKENQAAESMANARIIVAAMRADEGMMSVISQENREKDLQQIERSLKTAEILFELGNYDAVITQSKHQLDKAEALRDSILESVNQERVKTLADIAKEAMVVRGFEDVEVTQTKDGHHIEGKRDQTDFWVDINTEGEFCFDLGKDGFSTQQACTTEIDAFLNELKKGGVKLDVDVNTPTLGQEKAPSGNGQREESREQISEGQPIKS